MSWSDEPCMVRPILIDLNPVELKDYPFMISVDKCSGSCNVLSPIVGVPKKKKKQKTKDAKLVNMITNEMKRNNHKTYFMCL